jgi:hypothetical protein
MNETQVALLKKRWHKLLRQLSSLLGEEPDLQGIIFLIGVQELGKGYKKFEKHEKQDLMHIATCKLLSYDGYYGLESIDEDGWPHYKLIKELPRFSLKEQDLILKNAITKYFEASGFDLSSGEID